MGVHSIDLAIIALYLLLMLYMGYRGWRLSKTSADYLVAGRRLGYSMYIGCLSAVALGGASTVGTAENAEQAEGPGEAAVPSFRVVCVFCGLLRLPLCWVAPLPGAASPSAPRSSACSPG